MPNRTCWLCKYWTDEYCDLNHTKTDITTKCSSFISIPCCNDCKHWTRDYDDYSFGVCDVYKGTSNYDSICKAGYYESRTGTYGSNYSNTYRPPATQSASQSSSRKPHIIKVIIAIMFLEAIGAACYLFLGNGLGKKNSNTSGYISNSRYTDKASGNSSKGTSVYTSGGMSNSSDYFFPSDTVLLTTNDLIGKSKEELSFMRNEIFARKGYIFKTEPYKSYFTAKSWYKPNPDFSYDMLNSTEIQNVEFIQQFENR